MPRRRMSGVERGKSITKTEPTEKDRQVEVKTDIGIKESCESVIIVSLQSRKNDQMASKQRK